MIKGKKEGVIAILFSFLLLSIFIISIIPSASASTILVTSYDSDTISLLDTSNEEIKNITLKGGPSRIALTPDKKTAIIVMNNDNSIVLFDLIQFREISRINVGRKPNDLLIHNNNVYVINSNSDEVVEIDLDTKTISRRIEVGKKPVRISMFGESKLITSDANSDTISVIDLEKWEIITQIEIDGEPGALSSNIDNSKIYFVDVKNKELREIIVKDYTLTNNTFQIGRVTSDNDLIVGNKFALLSSNIGYRGEVLLFNLEENSWKSLNLESKISSMDMDNGVIYVVSGKNIIRLNEETNIKKIFEFGYEISDIEIIKETYVPLGDIEITNEDEFEAEGEEALDESVPFPWKRLAILLVILVILGLFLRRSTKFDEEEDKKEDNKEENKKDDNKDKEKHKKENLEREKDNKNDSEKEENNIEKQMKTQKTKTKKQNSKKTSKKTLQKESNSKTSKKQSNKKKEIKLKNKEVENGEEESE